MKMIRIYIAVTLLVFAALGCSVVQDRPSQADMVKVLNDVHLEDFAIDKSDYAGRDRQGKYTVGVWGHAKDVGGADINFFAIMLFEKKGSEWQGSVPGFGLFAQPVTEISKEDFYKTTTADWEKLKAKIKSGK